MGYDIGEHERFEVLIIALTFWSWLLEWTGTCAAGHHIAEDCVMHRLYKVMTGGSWDVRYEQRAMNGGQPNATAMM